jgi:hypothetical protein
VAEVCSQVAARAVSQRRAARPSSEPRADDPADRLGEGLGRLGDVEQVA